MDKIQRGQDAKRESEVLKSAFDELEADILAEWSGSVSEDPAFREKCFDRLLALKDVREKLHTFVSLGAIAQANKQA